MCRATPDLARGYTWATKAHLWVPNRILYKTPYLRKSDPEKIRFSPFKGILGVITFLVFSSVENKISAKIFVLAQKLGPETGSEVGMVTPKMGQNGTFQSLGEETFLVAPGLDTYQHVVYSGHAESNAVYPVFLSLFVSALARLKVDHVTPFFSSNWPPEHLL